MDPKKIGVLAVLGAGVMWSLEPIFAKLSYVHFNFVQTSAIRAIIVALIAAVYIIFTNKASFRVKKEEIPKLIYLGIAGTVIADLLYFLSLTTIPVVNALLIAHMQPIFIVMFGFLFLKADKLTKNDYIGISIMLFAGVIVTLRGFSSISVLRFGTVGDLFAFFATIAWATTTIVMKRYLSGLNAGIISFYRYITASLILVLYLLFTSSFVMPDKYQILVGIVVGIGSILYYEALKRIKAAQVSALELSGIFFASILGFLVLGENITIMQSFGVVMLFFGVYFLSKRENVKIRCQESSI